MKSPNSIYWQPTDKNKNTIWTDRNMPLGCAAPAGCRLVISHCPWPRTLHVSLSWVRRDTDLPLLTRAQQPIVPADQFVAIVKFVLSYLWHFPLLEPRRTKGLTFVPNVSLTNWRSQSNGMEMWGACHCVLVLWSLHCSDSHRGAILTSFPGHADAHRSLRLAALEFRAPIILSHGTHSPLDP